MPWSLVSASRPEEGIGVPVVGIDGRVLSTDLLAGPSVSTVVVLGLLAPRSYCLWS